MRRHTFLSRHSTLTVKDGDTKHKYKVEVRTVLDPDGKKPPEVKLVATVNGEQLVADTREALREIVLKRHDEARNRKWYKFILVGSYTDLPLDVHNCYQLSVRKASEIKTAPAAWKTKGQPDPEGLTFSRHVDRDLGIYVLRNCFQDENHRPIPDTPENRKAAAEIIRKKERYEKEIQRDFKRLIRGQRNRVAPEV